MIGQENLKNNLLSLIQNKKFPQSSIICGSFGSGRKEISKYIASNLDADIIILENKMDVLNENLNELYPNTVYVLDEFDNANFRVKYKILKILEEPPIDTYFIIICSNLENIYPPILSRCHIFYMDSYSNDELLRFAKENDLSMTLIDICDTPNDIVLLNEYNINEFNNFVDIVYNNFAKVQISNALKISTNVSLKKDSEGYSLKLLLKALSKLFFENKQYEEVLITNKYLVDLSNVSTNKQMLFDSWLFDVRRIYANKRFEA